jgi:hypothetical protein
MVCLIPKVGLAVALLDDVDEATLEVDLADDTEEMELEALETPVDVLLTEL